jgi:hypothetical protein
MNEDKGSSEIFLSEESYLGGGELAYRAPERALKGFPKQGTFGFTV